MPREFDHERLEVYRAARDFNRAVAELLGHMPRGDWDSRDNLTRAARSVTRNIAEGAGRWSVRDKVKFYTIARGSVTECAPCLDELVDYRLATPARIAPLKAQLARIAAMLVAMIHSVESRTPTPAPARPPAPALDP